MKRAAAKTRNINVDKEGEGEVQALECGADVKGVVVDRAKEVESLPRVEVLDADARDAKSHIFACVGNKHSGYGQILKGEAACTVCERVDDLVDA